MDFDFSRILATFNALQSGVMSATPPTSIVDEAAPTDQEAWIKKNKKHFIDQYGKKKGTEVLYATAWKRHNKVNESFGASDWGERIQDVWSGIAHDLMAVGGIDGSGARETVNDRLYNDYGDAWRNLPHNNRQELLQKYLSDDEVAAAQPEVQDNFESDDFDNEVNFNDNYESDEEIDKWGSDREAEEAARVPVPNDEGKYCPNCGEVFDSSKEECRNCHTGLVSMKLSESINKKKVNESICNNCTADGVIPCQVCNGHAGNDKCSECKGTGEMNCPECNGKGYVIDKKMKKIKEAFKYNDHHLEGADDYCEACFKHVANHECDEGILCDYCYHDIYGGHPNNFDIPAEENEDDLESIDVEEMWPVKESISTGLEQRNGEPLNTKEADDFVRQADEFAGNNLFKKAAEYYQAAWRNFREIINYDTELTDSEWSMLDRKMKIAHSKAISAGRKAYSLRSLDECSDCGSPESNVSDNSINITTSYDSKTNRKSMTITADNEKAEELARIIELSGLNPSITVPPTEEPKQLLLEPETDCVVTEAKSYSIQARKTKTSPLTYLSLTPTKWVSSKDKAFKFDDRESAVTKAASIKGKNEFTDIKVIPNLNESKLNEFHAKGHECDFCGNSLSQSDYTAAGKWSYKCGSCGFKYNHGGETPEAQIRTQLKSGKIDQGDSYSYLDESAEPKRIKHPGVKCSAKDCKKIARWRMQDGKMMCDNCKTLKDKTVDESLMPSRSATGLNGAPKSWANEPNEQIAHWRAVCDDTQGLSQPHDMFPNRIGDNPLKVAVNKVDKPLHENAKINAIAEKLSNKFSKTIENEAIDNLSKKKKNPGKCPQCGSKNTRWRGTSDDAICDSCKEKWSSDTLKESSSEQSLREKLSSLKKRYNMAVTAKAPNRRAIKAEIERVKNKLADSIPSESLTENDAKYTANQLNFKHLESKLATFGYVHSPEEEESGNHSSHVFTRGDGDFITLSKDGKFDWAINDEFGFSKEGNGKTSLLNTLAFHADNPMDTLDTIPTTEADTLDSELEDTNLIGNKKFNACPECAGLGKVDGEMCPECFGEGTGPFGDEFYV